MLLVMTRKRQAHIRQTVFSMDVPGIDHVTSRGWRGGTDSWSAGRIKLVHDRLHIFTCLVCWHISAHCGHRQDLQPRIEQRLREGHGIVNAGITSNDQLAGHTYHLALTRRLLMECDELLFRRL